MYQILLSIHTCISCVCIYKYLDVCMVYMSGDIRIHRVCIYIWCDLNLINSHSRAVRDCTQRTSCLYFLCALALLLQIAKRCRILSTTFELTTPTLELLSLSLSPSSSSSCSGARKRTPPGPEAIPHATKCPVSEAGSLSLSLSLCVLGFKCRSRAAFAIAEVSASRKT